MTLKDYFRMIEDLVAPASPAFLGVIMKCSEVAELLLKTPDAEVLLRVVNDWVEVCGVRATGQHRNAVTLAVQNSALGGGVIVVAPDE